MDVSVGCGPSLVARKKTVSREPARLAQAMGVAQFPVEEANCGYAL
jgi:hypothetical protein